MVSGAFGNEVHGLTPGQRCNLASPPVLPRTVVAPMRQVGYTNNVHWKIVFGAVDQLLRRFFRLCSVMDIIIMYGLGLRVG